MKVRRIALCVSLAAIFVLITGIAVRYFTVHRISSRIEQLGGAASTNCDCEFYENSQHDAPGFLEKHFNIVPKIRCVHLAGTKTSNTDILMMTKLRNLEHLHLNSTPIDSACLGYLVQMPSLQFVDVTNTSLNASSIESLRQDRPQVVVRFDDVPFFADESDSSVKSEENSFWESQRDGRLSDIVDVDIE